jgi:hypothetical protein
MRVSESQKTMLNIISGAANIASDLPSEEVPITGTDGGEGGEEPPAEEPAAEEKKEEDKPEKAKAK